MATDILMHNLGFDTQEARIVEWLKRPGEPVRKGDIIAIIESDKANVELESVADGTLLEHLFPADTMVAVGSPIARVGAPAEVTDRVTASASPPSPNPNVSPIARRIADENNINLAAVTGSGAGGKIMRQDVEALLAVASASNGGSKSILALPKVRKAARQAGIDLHTVKPTGHSGQITMADLQDVMAIANSQKPNPVETPQRTRESTVEKSEVTLSRMRQIIGQRLSKSMQDAPHFYVTGEFDLEDALRTLSIFPEPRPRVNDLLQYLTVQTLLHVPQLNATYRDGKLYRHVSVNLAVAVGLDDGLLTPTIPNAERYSLQGMAAESRALVERARAGHLRPDDLREGTFTISNLGIIKQVEQFTAVINPPQVAILAVGTVKQRPVVLDGGLHIRHTVKLTLSGDHRVVDGLVLGQFMAAFQTELDHFNARS
ncbi:MAG: 2-oxo acid dehydrogenase subunit E2 [Anaerolineae bacterium]|nr:2-oxo acid dehydrogenase subunit E2 [Anaerolineae bacterium]